MSAWTDKMHDTKLELIAKGYSPSKAQAMMNDHYNDYKHLIGKCSAYLLATQIVDLNSPIEKSTWLDAASIGFGKVLSSTRRSCKDKSPHLWQCDVNGTDMYGNTYGGNF